MAGTRVVFCGILLALSACASAEKLYERGQERESQGRYLEAVDYYIRVLKKDREMHAARERLAGVAPKAADQFRARADNYMEAHEYELAAGAMSKLNTLRSRCLEVGVRIGRVDEDRAKRRKIFDLAIQKLITEAQQLERERRYRAAFGLYDKAQQSYEPSPAQREEITAARYRTLLAWAEAEIARKRYMAAYTAAEDATQIYGVQDTRSQAARELRDRAIGLGTVEGAVLPAWRDRRVKLPDGFLGDFNDILADEHWTKPPIFVVISAPREVRRHVRDLEFDREILSDGRAATVGAQMKADFTVVVSISHYETSRRGPWSTRTARTRDGAVAQYKFFDGLHILDVHATYRIVSVEERETVDEGEVDAQAESAVRRARYDGDPRDLKLSREEREWFRPGDREDTNRDLEREVLRKLAARLAESVYKDLQKQVR